MAPFFVLSAQTLTRDVAVAEDGTAKVVFQWRVPEVESELQRTAS
jgi:hypothetical protein